MLSSRKTAIKEDNDQLAEIIILLIALNIDSLDIESALSNFKSLARTKFGEHTLTFEKEEKIIVRLL